MTFTAGLPAAVAVPCIVNVASASRRRVKHGHLSRGDDSARPQRGRAGAGSFCASFGYGRVSGATQIFDPDVGLAVMALRYASTRTRHMKERLARDKLVKRATARLQHGLETGAQAAAVAEDICVLIDVLGLGDDAEVLALRDRWNELVQAHCTDALATRTEYFIRLARSAGELLGEEILKLISLAKDLHVLQRLGMEAPRELLAECEQALRERIARQSGIKAVAVGLVRPWDRQLWCYELLLGSKVGA